MYIINFKTIRYKLTASVDIIYSIFNYQLTKPVGNSRLRKEPNQAKTANSRKKRTPRNQQIH